MKFLQWLFGANDDLFDEHPRHAPMPAKDPTDWTLTPNSREWDWEYYCPQCKSGVDHREVMADVCNTCGRLGSLFTRRAMRRIWNGDRWMLQRKYGNHAGQWEIIETTNQR